MLNWFLQLLFDKFDCIFIVYSLDLKHKKLNCFLEHQKFLIYRGTRIKIGCFLNAGPYCIQIEFLGQIFLELFLFKTGTPFKA